MVATAVVEVAAAAPVFGNLAGLLVARRAAVAIGSSRVGMEERFFYHSFPRRGAATADENDKGCKILAAIRDFGLLLTPQLIEWNQPNVGGTPRTFPVLQKRVCFTELGPRELPQHAEKFGHFALEFEIDTVRRLGAVPVFYVPQPTSEAARMEARSALPCWL